MNTTLLIAAALIVLVGGAHSYLGERYILIRLFRKADLPRLFGSDTFTRRTLRFAWHITTVAWLGFAALLLQLARGPQNLTLAQTGSILSLTSFASAATAAVGSRGRHLSWIAFAVIGVLIWIGTH